MVLLKYSHDCILGPMEARSETAQSAGSENRYWWDMGPRLLSLDSIHLGPCTHTTKVRRNFVTHYIDTNKVLVL